MHILSLILGFGAWGVALAAIFRRKPMTGWSFSLCAASLYLQIAQTNILVKKPDWAAIEDTYPAIFTAATVLIGVTAMLNIIAAIVARKKN